MHKQTFYINQRNNKQGTRTSIDFVEIPSILFEKFVSDYSIVSQFAVHHQTGKPIPLDLYKQMHKSRSSGVFNETYQQALLAIVDQQYHSLAAMGKGMYLYKCLCNYVYIYVSIHKSGSSGVFNETYQEALLSIVDQPYHTLAA